MYSSSTHQLLRGMPRVRVDDAKVAALIGRHFVSGGLRQLAYYAGIPRKPLDEDVRRAAFIAFAKAEGVACTPFEPPGDRRLTPGVHMPSLIRWLEELPKPVGIAAWNIHFARWIVHACAARSIDVPEQVAIVAWDDDPMIAETAEPTISAIALPAERLGFEAANLLDKLMRGIPSEQSITIDPSGVLNVRQSSDMAALKDRDVYLALQFIREHATEPLKVPQIAKHLRISRKKLELDFARVTGQTPYQAITQVRLEHAKRLLLETDWRTDRVARQSGVGTEPTLRRLLLEHEGMTPGEFRIRFGPI